MAKVGTQLLLNARDRDRVRRLALVRGQLQAEMLRQLVEHALSVYENMSTAELNRLNVQLERLGVPE
jgi:phage tail tape-measure protein